MNALLLALLLGAPDVLAQQPPDESDADEDTDEDGGEGGDESGDESGDKSSDPPAEPLPFDLSAAEEAPELDREKYAWLKPTRGRLDQNPYAQVDFTAYSLEWGEVKIGIASIQAGILPRVQLGTAPSLDALGVFNLTAKANLLRAGPVDVGLSGRLYQLPQADFTGALRGGSASTSVIVTPGWSLHGEVGLNHMEAGGLPNPANLPAFLITNREADLEAWHAEAKANGLRFDMTALATTVRVATDVRLNRRDSFILQGQAMVWNDITSGVSGTEELPPVLNMDEWANQDRSGAVPVEETFVASVSYQASWKQVDLRMGVGASAIPGAWLLQAFELSYRFGGKTRTEERRMRKGWRKNADEVEG